MHVDAAFVSSGNTLTVEGTSGNDNIVVSRVPNNDSFLQVVVNGQTEFAGRRDTIGRMTINGLAGGDEIIIDDDLLAIPATVNGGDGIDTIEVRGSAANNFITSMAGRGWTW
ncbi:hypothetical protein [Fontivita pretiosa]|uniref:hypothetical protein n=1 Tax=Fontivita pretiosa TaxID=2989684 RepID=UPI003D16B52B